MDDWNRKRDEAKDSFDTMFIIFVVVGIVMFLVFICIVIVVVKMIMKRGGTGWYHDQLRRRRMRGLFGFYNPAVPVDPSFGVVLHPNNPPAQGTVQTTTHIPPEQQLLYPQSQHPCYPTGQQPYPPQGTYPPQQPPYPPAGQPPYPPQDQLPSPSSGQPAYPVQQYAGTMPPASSAPPLVPGSYPQQYPATGYEDVKPPPYPL